MRYIRVEALTPPAGWAERAAEALEEVTALPGDERAQGVSDRSEIWREMKPSLEALSHGKCWYCESKEIRSDNAVDHFRPKSRVKECPDHCGYWWVAFEISNYRFACTFCNSRRIDEEGHTEGGKQDHFPLEDEERRAHSPQDRLGRERPMLLDPLCAGDPSIIWFDESGRAVPNPSRCNVTHTKQRAEVSLRLLHLNQGALCDRRADLCRTIRRKVKHADTVVARADEGDPSAAAALDEALHDLTSFVQPDAVFSAAAKAMLASLRGSSPVADAVFQTA